MSKCFVEKGTRSQAYVRIIIVAHYKISQLNHTERTPP